MHVLVVNAGSRTLKLRLLDIDDVVVAAHDIDPWSGEADLAEIDRFVGGLAQIDAVGHRVVHGGEQFVRPVKVDAQVLRALLELADLAPLHQRRSLAAVRAVADIVAGVPVFACFDTAYHASLPPAAATYALPLAWRQRWPVRRFGFHGLSHAYAARRGAALVGRRPGELRVVTCHLGAGASLCATASGEAQDTTMGFTPLDGLVMATRSGSVDPGLVCWLVEHGGLDIADVAHGLERESGLVGLAGGTGDMREILARVERGDSAAQLAFSVYVHRLRREIAAMVAALGGLDVLVFTGGVGEHQPQIRAAAAATLGFLGVGVDADLNSEATTDADVSASGAGARTLVVTAREDIEITRQVRQLLQ
jgi:acetate kinase